MTTIDNNLKLLSATEQTRLSWTKAIRNYDQIPSAYQAAFTGHFKSTDDFPYTLLAPFNGSFLKPTYEKLVSCTEDSITIFERQPERINVTAYKLNAINYTETGSVQWSQKLHGVTWDGTDRPVYNIPVALSIMVFFALCAQCAATLAVIRRETNSWRWPAFTFAYMTTLAYFGAMATYQLGMRIGG